MSTTLLPPVCKFETDNVADMSYANARNVIIKLFIPQQFSFVNA